jgi:hypothetical protein
MSNLSPKSRAWSAVGARQTLLALDVLDRRKPQERTRRASVSMMPICDYDDC